MTQQPTQINLKNKGKSNFVMARQHCFHSMLDPQVCFFFKGYNIFSKDAFNHLCEQYEGWIRK